MRRSPPSPWLAALFLLLPGAALADDPPPPARERERAGTRAPAKQPVLLLARRGDSWARVGPDGLVFTGDSLVSLPGSSAEIRLDSGGRLLLSGRTPELAQRQLAELLLDSAVTLHRNPDFDLDLTLDRGRIYVTNGKDKGPLTVRLRVSTEVWDIKLDGPGAEIGVDLLRHYPRDVDWQQEEPLVAAFLIVLNGKVSLKVAGNVFPNLEGGPGSNSFCNWDNKGPRRAPGRIPEASRADLHVLWDKQPRPTANAPFDPHEALRGLAARLERSESPEAALKAALEAPERPVRIMALYALGALDAVPPLLGALADGDPAHAFERERAVFTLRRWLSRGRENNRRLYDPETKQGLAIQAGYTPGEAHTLAVLLHDFSVEDARKPETFELLALELTRKDRVAIRELAYWQLQHLSQPLLPGAAPPDLPPYNAAGPEPQRKALADAVRKLLKEGQLPPALPRPPQPPR